MGPSSVGVLEEYQSELYVIKKTLLTKNFKHTDVENIVQCPPCSYHTASAVLPHDHPCPMPDYFDANPRVIIAILPINVSTCVSKRK